MALFCRVHARRARCPWAEAVAAVRAAQPVHLAVARLAVEVAVAHAVYLHVPVERVDATLPPCMAWARPAVAGHLYEADARLGAHVEGAAHAVLRYLGAHVAAHGHVDAVHDGLPPRLGVSVRDRGDALARCV